MNRRERFVIAGLAVGAISGFGSGIVGLAQRQHMLEHMSRTCVDAAMREVGRSGDLSLEHAGHHGRMEYRVRAACAEAARRYRPGSV